MFLKSQPVIKFSSGASITRNIKKLEIDGQEHEAGGVSDEQLHLCQLFAPRSLVDVLRNGSLKSSFGCCLLVDISGFTNLSSTLCEDGVQGLDKLRSITDNSLGKFVESIYEYGGDGNEYLSFSICI
jgi:hypothetical protein